VADVAALRAELDERGYAIVQNLLDQAQVAEARSALDDLLAATPQGRNDFEGFSTRRVYSLLAKTRALDGIAAHPLLLELCNQLLGHHQLSATVAIQIGPGETAQGLHFDDALYPLPRPHDEVMISTMWAIDDFVGENGATVMVPGSHRWTDEAPGRDPAVEYAEMPAGSVAIYVGSLWHGGGANRTDRPRLGITFEYIASWLRPQENHLAAVPPERARELPEVIAELLGYNIRAPFMGYVDGRHPRRLLS
jgi:ectoine hydroxylase-related dioxygenase (phytanoyl-CoA dioxygenase family)